MDLKYDNAYMDRQLMEFNIQKQTTNVPTFTTEHPNRSYSIMKKLKNIFTSFCPDPYVSHSWITMMLELFVRLHADGVLQYVETIEERDYERISQTLDNCLKKIKPVKLHNEPKFVGKNICTDTSLAGLAYGYCRDNNCINVERVLPAKENTKKEFAKRHAVPEVAWNLISIAHPICIDEFKNNYGNYHLFQDVMEKLFTTRIRNYWHNPAYVGNPKIQTRLVGPSLEERLHNMEICVGSAYKIKNKENRGKLGPFVKPIPRLVRPQPKTHLKRKRRSTGGASTELKCLSKGREVDHLPIYCTTNCSDTPVFVCIDRKCIPDALACNKIGDCRDKSDEDPVTCRTRCEDKGGHWCAAEQTCLGDQRCDGKPDCGDRSDEVVAMCREWCSSQGGSLCDTSQCISPKNGKDCDNKKDCQCGYDERCSIPLGGFYAHTDTTVNWGPWGDSTAHCPTHPGCDITLCMQVINMMGAWEFFS